MEPSTEIVSGLVDITHLTSVDIDELENDVLASSLRRIKEEALRPDEATAGFNSSF